MRLGGAILGTLPSRVASNNLPANGVRGDGCDGSFPSALDKIKPCQ